jgi:hypothetical protein
MQTAQAINIRPPPFRGRFIPSEMKETPLTEHGHTADRWRVLDTGALARAAHGREPTRGEVVSVRRALAALMRAGEVRIHMNYGHRHYWVRAQARRERPG